MKKILVTGSAGFIGAALVKKLLDRGDWVIGIDNHNNYYDQDLKEARLNLFKDNSKYSHFRFDISESLKLNNLFESQKPSHVVNLAAQAGVRYSIENPAAYIESNIVGFANILEACRNNEVKHLIYASSSSVYGANTKLPFSPFDNVNHPLSLYAATKKSNELMAHSYSHLYKLPTTGLRFFTVYGPWGRPDMSIFKFTKAILSGESIKVYNFGKHKRDFTYIDDVVEGLLRVIDNPAKQNPNWVSSSPDSSTSLSPWRIYNIGNSKSIDLEDLIASIEKATGIKAIKKFLPMQAGDVVNTYADVKSFTEDFKYKSTVDIDSGINNFVIWFRKYYKL